MVCTLIVCPERDLLHFFISCIKNQFAMTSASLLYLMMHFFLYIAAVLRNCRNCQLLMMPLHLSQFWNIVPLERLLAQLEVEKSASVIRRLVKLLVNSFHPTSKGVDVQVS